jgi:hypothetical protein
LHVYLKPQTRRGWRRKRKWKRKRRRRRRRSSSRIDSGLGAIPEQALVTRVVGRLLFL